MRLLLLSAVLCATMNISANATVPASITVQGRLNDSLGVPLPAGVKGFLFRIFNAPVGGTEIWSGEDQILPTDSEGLWAAQVGAIVGLTDAVFTDTVRWLDINVNGTQLPRVRLVTGPYAHRVSTVDGATGGTITSKVSIGSGHTNSGNSAFVAGENNSASGSHSVIGGGENNRASGTHSTVAGGQADTASNFFATVAGGTRNVASGYGCAVAGGKENRAGALQYSFVGGGFDNIASGEGASVTGGFHGRARGNYSVVSGGGGGGEFFALDSNAALGLCSVVPGGSRNVAGGNFSFAAGRDARALHRSTFVWADSAAGAFSSTDVGQFLIRASGGVGIGTNNPDVLFHVQDGSAGTVAGNSNSAAVFERNEECWVHLLSPDTTVRGILFGSPANALMGSIRFNPRNGGEEKGYEIRGRNNNILVEIDSLGNLNARGNLTAVGTCCSSDERLKRNIRSLAGGLDKVTCLRGVSYEWKPDASGERIFPSGEQIGLIAQEVQQVVPQAVNEDEDGYLAVDYTRLVPLLIEAIKEQQTRIESLEHKLERITP